MPESFPHPPVTAPAESGYISSTSRVVPPPERYQNWLRPMLVDFEADDPSPLQRCDFRGELKAILTPARGLHSLRSDDFQGGRSRRHIRRGDSEELCLIYVVGGRIESRYEGDVEQVISPGQFLLYDAWQACRMRLRNPHIVQVDLPRAHLQSIVSNGRKASEVTRALAISPLSELLGLQLGRFGTLVDKLNATERLAMLRATEALAVTTLEAVLGSKAPQETGNLQGLYELAQRYIRAHLDMAGLNATRIAARLGCSRTMLYRAFGEQGICIAQHIRELRLQKLARLLQSPNHGKTIAQLAHECGLQDSPNVSRLFRRRFGVSPRDFRRGVRID